MLYCNEYNDFRGMHENNRIPGIFCWTRMGTEAGQGLNDILKRKELERQAGDGFFAWGIGNSLGSATLHAKQSSADGEIDVLFTPMKSPPKSTDVKPPVVLLWLSYYGCNGLLTDLPRHVLVTSRGGKRKHSHYALLCHSASSIVSNNFSGSFSISEVRNFASNKPVGASQVTSVVKYKAGCSSGARYHVSFRAKLHDHGFVKLARPIVLRGDVLELYYDICRVSSCQEWFVAIDGLRSLALKTYMSVSDQYFLEL